MKLNEDEKERLIKELVKAGAIRRDKPLTPEDSYYSRSIGKKGLPIIEIKI